MRFAVLNERLIPEPLLTSQEQTYSISFLEHLPHPTVNHQFTVNQELQQLLTGKQLLLDEIPFPLKEIQEHYENGYIMYRKGIIIEKKKFQCNRCGNDDPNRFADFPCSRCGERCTYCRKCIMMGRVSTCTPLYSWRPEEEELARFLDSESAVNNDKSVMPIPEPKFVEPNQPNKVLPNPAKLEWSGTLSEGQAAASKQVIQAIINNKELLVWAVCGAGKTEVLFKGIEEALTRKKRVCIATPRTDVVLELTPRLQKVFPNLHVASLYGGSEDRHKLSPLTIATTHQLLRFYEAFDTIILDEVDAFPYSIDKTLQYAVKNARKEVSSMIYLTATPNSKWQKECRSGKRDYFTIPARYHRHPLPVPRFIWCGNWQKLLKKNKLPPIVLKWLQQRIESEKQALLFIPQIDLFEKILPILRDFHSKIETIHAEDPSRKEKVAAMRNKEIPILVTTTILERGVTFPNLDVAVLGAEDQIFTESALVQIAGRVGRSAQFPKGDITFFHYGKTEAMVRARNQIVRMNKEAFRRGLIDYE